MLPVNATTASLMMLLLVLGAATVWGLSEAIFTSVAAVLAFNFYFLPPVGTFTICGPGKLGGAICLSGHRVHSQPVVVPSQTAS